MCSSISGREVGTLAARAGITLWELAPQAGSLEDAYLALTRESLDYQDKDRVPGRAPVLPTHTPDEELAS